MERRCDLACDADLVGDHDTIALLDDDGGVRLDGEGLVTWEDEEAGRPRPHLLVLGQGQLDDLGAAWVGALTDKRDEISAHSDRLGFQFDRLVRGAEQ